MAWKVDAVHSAVEFSVKHMMISTARGRFEKFDITVDLDENHPELASISATIDAASLNTREEKRDAHLRSPEFFDVEKYPNITFKSTKITQEGKDNFTIAGDLTIRDTTHPVVFKAHSEGRSKHPFTGLSVWGFSAETTINRKDWGLSWNVALETGGFMLADQIKITLDIELAQEAEVAKAEASV